MEIDRLIQEGADVNCANELGETPLFLLIKNRKHDEGVKKSNDSLRDESFIKTAKLFIEHGVNVDHKDEREGLNALLLLCRHYHNDNLIDLVRLLFKSGIDIDCKGNDGWDALSLLCLKYNKNNLIDIIQLLVEHGFDVNCENNDGWNALLLLCRYYDKDNLIVIVQKLIEHGIDVNFKTNNGWNALHILCSVQQNVKNLKDTIELLIKNGIETGAKTTDSPNMNARSLLLQRYKEEDVGSIILLLNMKK